MIISKKYRSVLLLSLFFISLVFQLVYTYNALSGKQFFSKNHSTNLVPNKNNTGDNLLSNFIEEETEDGDETETINLDLNLVLSYIHFVFFDEQQKEKISSKISLNDNSPIFIEIRNLRV
jgi:hypothetical protein